MRRRLRILALLAVLGLLTFGAWVIFDWPPPRLLLEYGLPPAGGPTGREEEVEGIRFIELSPGYFRMGSHYLCERGDLLGLVGSILGREWGTPAEHDRTECPRRWVEIEEPFWISVNEITNAQFDRRIRDHERCEYSSEDDQPVVRVSWWAAKRFCRAMSEWWVSDEYDFRLPTEAEWEYACRAGVASEVLRGREPKDLAARAHHEPADGPFPWESEHKPVAVGDRLPNAWGLHDMLGNVWEWCSDNGPDGSVRIFRGGGCRSGAGDCRPATRRWTVPGRRIAFLGFRPVMVPKVEE